MKKKTTQKPLAKKISSIINVVSVSANTSFLRSSIYMWDYMGSLLCDSFFEYHETWDGTVQLVALRKKVENISTSSANLQCKFSLRDKLQRREECYTRTFSLQLATRSNREFKLHVFSSGKRQK